MHKNNPECSKLEITEFPISLLEQITRNDILEYLDYVSYYTKDSLEITNEERGKSRKISSLRSFYRYFYENEQIKKKV